MKSFTELALGLIALGGCVTAFPRAITDPSSPGYPAYRTFVESLEGQQAKRNLLERDTTTFNATAQRVSTTGANAYIAPGPNDVRGECPGLNAMANHGYIPRNGFATSQQFIDGTFAAFGMGSDLAGFLAYFGSFVDGNGSGWTIGSGPRVGIGGSHNNYETDSSPLKSDLFQYGINGRLILEQFYNLYNMQPNAATANYNLDVLRDFRAQRYNESIAKNPYFAYQPFPGILVSQAAFTFIYRFMSNKSAAYPEGRLDKTTLKSFMSITGPENNLTWTFGHERFPDVFYKRAIGDEYTIPFFFSDVGYFAQKYPQILSVGCNTGTVNSFVSIPPEKLSGGAYTQPMVNANPGCFAVQMTSALALQGANLTASAAKNLNNLVATSLKGILGSASCPAITKPNLAYMMGICPGFQGFYGGPTAAVAPGAIQNN